MIFYLSNVCWPWVCHMVPRIQNQTVSFSHEQVSLRMRCKVKQIQADIRYVIFFPCFPTQRPVKMWNIFSRKERLQVNHGKPRRESNPSSRKSGVLRAVDFCHFLRFELCETCSFGAPLLVFVLRPDYGEMPLYCSKVCARPLQHGTISGSYLYCFVPFVFSRWCDNCNCIIFFLGWALTMFDLSWWLIYMILYAYFYVLFNSVFIFPAWRKNASWFHEQSGKKKSMAVLKLLLQGLRVNTQTHGVLCECNVIACTFVPEQYGTV